MSTVTLDQLVLKHSMNNDVAANDADLLRVADEQARLLILRATGLVDGDDACTRIYIAVREIINSQGQEFETQQQELEDLSTRLEDEGIAAEPSLLDQVTNQSDRIHRAALALGIAIGTRIGGVR